MCKKLILLLMVVVICYVNSMHMPGDVEILDGFSDLTEDSPEYYNQDTYYELKSLTNDGTKAIRNKRSVLSEHVDDTDNKSKITQPDSSSIELKTRERRHDKKEFISESLPIPEKQNMDIDYYRKGSWNVQTLKTDYINRNDDDDLISDSANNEGIKGRTPRVNFITQQKSLDQLDRSVLPKLVTTKSQQFEKLEEAAAPDEIFPPRSYDPYLRRYDRFDEFHPYYDDYYVYRRRFDPYDSYSPRMPPYSNRYWSDRRYDIPEPRDYRPMYSNTIFDDKAAVIPPRSPHRRIVYYAHLPEIVRNIPRYDYRHRFDNNYIGPVTGAYTHDNNNNNNNNNNNIVNREKKDYRNMQSEILNRGNSLKNKGDV